MWGKNLQFQIVKGEREHHQYNGQRLRKPTVLIKLGNLSFSRRAAVLGGALALCQIMDGFLTYVGLSLMGIHMEGNVFLRQLMGAYGTAPVLFGAKFIALICVFLLTVPSHSRIWLRPIIGGLSAAYLGLAVIPWVYLISKVYAS